MEFFCSLFFLCIFSKMPRGNKRKSVPVKRFTPHHTPHKAKRIKSLLPNSPLTRQSENTDPKIPSNWTVENMDNVPNHSTINVVTQPGLPAVPTDTNCNEDKNQEIQALKQQIQLLQSSLLNARQNMPTNLNPTSPTSHTLPNRPTSLTNPPLATHIVNSVDVNNQTYSYQPQSSAIPTTAQSLNSILSPLNPPEPTPENSLFQTPILVPCIPLHSFITPEQRSKIKKDQYVDFHSLLNSFTTDKVFALKPQETDDGFVTAFTEVRPKRKPMSLVAWSRAFARFCSTYLLDHKDQAQNLFNYLDTVMRLAQEGGDWHAYDKDFRQQRLTIKYSFGNMRSELYTTYFNKRTATVTAWGTNYPQPTHALTYDEHSQTHVPKGFCIAYHSPGKRCSSPDASACRYSHTCFKCRAQKYHPAHLCRNQNSPKLSQSSSNQQTNQSN